jgi:hypothetical protein
MVVQIEKNPKKLSFELRNKDNDSNDSIESHEEFEQLTLVVRLSKQVRKLIKRNSPPDFYSAFLSTSIDNELKLVREVVDLAEGKIWKDTMIEEMESFYNNEMWDLVELPSGRNTINSKWVSKKNLSATGQVEKFKA